MRTQPGSNARPAERARQRTPWIKPRLPELGIVFLGLVTAWILWLTATNTVEDELQQRFEEPAKQLSSALISANQHYLHGIQSIADFFQSGEEVDRASFSAFAGPLLSRFPGIHALEWVPRVFPEQRREIEHQAQVDGLAGFQITERRADGDLGPVTPRAEYYPVHFMESRRYNAPSFGFDLGSDPTLRVGLDKARDSGRTVVTQRVALMVKHNTADTPFGVRVIQPVYDSGWIPATVEERRLALRGFAVAVISIGDMIDAAVGRFLAADSFDLYLIDNSAGGDTRFLHHLSSNRGSTGPAISEEKLLKRPHVSSTYEVADRGWSLVATPVAGRADGLLRFAPWASAGAAILVFVLIAFFVAILRNRAQQIQREVDEATRELRDSLHANAAILNSVGEGIHGIGRDGKTIFVNPAAARMLGYEAGELENSELGVHELLHHEDLAAGPETAPESSTDPIGCDVCAALDQGTLESVRDGVFWRKDGSAFPVEYVCNPIHDEAGEIQGAVMTFSDITARKAAEERLRESEERTRKIFETVADGIITFDERGVIRSFNAVAEQQFGYGADEALGLNIRLLIPGETLTSQPRKPRQGKSQPRGGGTARQTHDLTGHRKDGSVFPLDLAISQTVLNGAVIYIASSRDNTERQAIHDQLQLTIREHRIARDLLERQSLKLTGLAEDLGSARDAAEAASNAKSDFLASMSHEIRTPLNGVLGMAGVLLDSQLTDDQRRQAQTIKDSGESLLVLINDILDLSKVEAGRLELEMLDFGLVDMLNSVADLWQSQISDKGLAFSIDVDIDHAPVLHSDPTRIRQILFNLVNNALKFTERGAITIKVTQSQVSDDRVETRFAVSDTGIGISEEGRARLFKSFSQADGSTTRKFGGTGLGLAICKRLAELLGGEIDVESQPGTGSTFGFTVRCHPGDPAKAVSQAELEGQQAPGEQGEGRRLRILVAEDNHINQAVIRAMFRKTDHHIDFVGDGSEAVAAVLRVPYDLVLMDVQMPEMDGPTATRKIRKLPDAAANIPIIALTANAMTGDREKYIAAGMDDYVSKPINPKELFAAIRRNAGAEIATPELSDEDLMAADPITAIAALQAEPAATNEDANAALDDLLSGLDELGGNNS